MELKSMYKNWLTNKAMVYLFIYSLFILMIVSILVVLKVVGYEWIVGFMLGYLSFLSGIWISKFAVKLLIKNENHFLFYFFFLLRLGIYAAPLFIAFFNNNQNIHYAGVLIGLSPLVFVPFLNKSILNLDNYLLKN